MSTSRQEHEGLQRPELTHPNIDSTARHTFLSPSLVKTFIFLFWEGERFLFSGVSDVEGLKLAVGKRAVLPEAE
jgi:hypothetical protein